MKTMKKLQVAAAAASLFALAGVTNAAQLNSSGATVAAETIFPTLTGANPGNNTRVKAPLFAYKYEGGTAVGASSAQQFGIVAFLEGAQWTTRAAALGRDTDPLLGGANATSWSPALARTIRATATVGGVSGRIAVLPAGTNPGPNEYALVVTNVLPGNQITNSPPTVSGDADTAVTFYFVLINNTAQPVVLEGLELAFSAFKDPALPAPTLGGTPDSTTTAINQFPTVYSLAGLSRNTNNTLCELPTGAVVLKAISGVNQGVGTDLALSQEEFQNNNGVTRSIPNYIRVGRATRLDLTKSGDRLVQTTNSFQTNLGTTPVNGVGGTGGGRFTFKPSTTQVANVYGGNNTGLFNVDNNVYGNPALGTPNATVGLLDGVFPERRTSGDERAAKLGVLNFSNVNTTVLDRLLDVDAYAFAVGTDPALPGVSHLPSLATRFGDFTVANPTPQAEANLFGGVDVSGFGPNATNESGAVVIGFTSKPNFGWRAAGGVLTLQRGNGTCADTVPGTALAGSLINPGGGTEYFWRFSRAELANASLNGTLFGDWQVCYNVSGETTIPAATFTNVFVRLLKDDSTEQPVQACTASLASIYGGVKIDVRNFQFHNGLAAPNPDQKEWVGLLRLINNSELETATVEGQFIHNSGHYGPWGTLATLAPREAKYVYAARVVGPANQDTGVPGIKELLTNPVANATVGLVKNFAPTDETTRIRISADVSTLRVQNYVFNTRTFALTELSSTQGADFVNVDSSNRDHIDQDAQFDIVKDTATLLQVTNFSGTPTKLQINNP